MTSDGGNDGTPSNGDILEAIGRLEKRLEAAGVFARVEAHENANADPQIEQLVLAGRKIAAIRRYREESGAALTVANDHVTRIEQQLRASGHRFPSNRGAWYGLLLLAALVAVVAAFAATNVLHGIR